MFTINIIQKYLRYLPVLLISLLFFTKSNYATNSSKINESYTLISPNNHFFSNNQLPPDDSVTMTRRHFRKLFYTATGYFFENRFEQAIPPLLELLRFDSENSHINFYVGACYMNLPEAKVAPIPYLQKAIKNTTIWYDYDYRSRAAPVFAYFYLAAVYRNNYKIQDAVLNNTIFKSYVSQDNESLLSEVNSEIKNLESGSYSNVEQTEYTKYFNKLLDNRIQYDVYIRNPEQDINWWVNNLEGIKRELLVNTILDAAYSGKATVYDENNKDLSNEEVKAIGNQPTLLKIKTPNPPYNDTVIMIENQLNRQLITKIRFMEEWYLDDQTLEIGKKVIGITPLIEEYYEDNTFKSYSPLFTLYFDDKYPEVLIKSKDSLTNNDGFPEDTITKITDLTVNTDYSASTKAQTVLTERIRYDVPINNIKSKSEWWIDNIELSKRYDFLKQIFDMVGNGLLQAYDVFDDSLTVRKARELTGLRTDTIKSKSPYYPYRDTIIEISKNVFDYNKISKIRFLEEWYLNEYNSQIAKKVIGIAPLIEVFDNNKVLKGYTSLFWVYFDKRYPIKLSQKVSNFKYIERF